MRIVTFQNEGKFIFNTYIFNTIYIPNEFVNAYFFPSPFRLVYVLMTEIKKYICKTPFFLKTINTKKFLWGKGLSTEF